MNDQDARETIVTLVTESQRKSGQVLPFCDPFMIAIRLPQLGRNRLTQELDELFKTYYSPNVDLDHVALTVRGRENVKKVLTC